MIWMISSWYGAIGENLNFEYKKDKATTQILNLNTKNKHENKHFIHLIPQTIFRRLFPFVLAKPTSNRKYRCFLSLVQIKVLVLAHFQESMRWLFPIQSFISLVIIFLFNGPDKKRQQNSMKTKRHSQQQEAKSVRRRTPSANETFFGTLSQGLCADTSLHCLLYFLAFD